MTNIVGCFSDKGKHSVSLILEWNVKPTFLRTFATEVEGVYASGKKKKKKIEVVMRCLAMAACVSVWCL